MHEAFYILVYWTGLDRRYLESRGCALLLRERHRLRDVMTVEAGSGAFAFTENDVSVVSGLVSQRKSRAMTDDSR